MPTHYEESLGQDIAGIQAKVQEMAGLAEQALHQSLQAFLSQNRPMAYAVILRDQYIDRLEGELDQLCLEFLVRQQPVANPLRFVFTTIKLNKELERIGDYAESIARQVLKLAPLRTLPIADRYREIGQLAIHMFHDAVQAFVQQDVELAERTVAIEEQADALRNGINAELIRLHGGEEVPLEALTPLVTVARRFERVTDQAKNICEETFYLCTGESIKHPGTGGVRVLFVDDDCSRLAPLAQAIGTQLGADRFIFCAAGLAPTELDAELLRYLGEKGLDTTQLVCQSVEQTPDRDHYQVVVALTAAARKALPKSPAKALTLFWPGPEPDSTASAQTQPKSDLDDFHRYLQSLISELVEGVLGINKDLVSP